MKNTYQIGLGPLTLDTIASIVEDEKKLTLSEEARHKISFCRKFLEEELKAPGRFHYGINTGFGALCNVKIPPEEIEPLQRNLVFSHAAGTGEEVPAEIVRLMLFLKVQSLSYGHSGVRKVLTEYLIHFYNHKATPVVFQLGSLGASGDLAPLAHLSLPLMGEGWMHYKGKKLPSAEVLQALDLPPLALQSKEGLALLNGTQFSAAYAVWCLLKARQLMRTANLCAAISADAYLCHLAPFDERLHRIRPFTGQQTVARSVLELLRGSNLQLQPRAHVQDPYAFRCVPQVHGASHDTISYVQQLTETEVNSVTDNPNIFPEDGDILSGGNFHGQPLALGLDFLAIALAELGCISERRVFQLLSGQRELPAFLSPTPGLHSGLMIAQYTAAAIVSQNKQLCTPASVDSIVSSNGQEDHVSMSANAATKAYRIVRNLERILAIEFMCAAQALAFRRPQKTSPALEAVIENYRSHVPELHEDRLLHADIEKTIAFLQKLEMA